MAVTPANNSPFLNATSGSGSSKSFLTTQSASPVQQMLDNQKSQTTSSEGGDSFYYSEDYLRMKAYEISGRIATYKNMGMTAQYSAAQQEGQMIVAQYQAYTKAAATGGDPIAAAKAVGQEWQKQSFARASAIFLIA